MSSFQKHILFCELKTAISVSVPPSLLLVSFLRILTDFLGLGIVTFLRIQRCVIEKSKDLTSQKARVRSSIHRCVILERPPNHAASFF